MNNQSTLWHLCCAILLFSTTLAYSQNFPGGVTGAEVWYIANNDDISQGIYVNSAQNNIPINLCGEHEPILFNFNSSIFSDKLCLYYNARLENSTGRNLFFVDEPYHNEAPLSHLGSIWDSGLTGFSLDSISRNFFDLNHQSIYAREIEEAYNSDNNAHVNFYHTNNYNIDKKFKSYGEKGESLMYIGRLTEIDNNSGYSDLDFHGSFPEFISFPRELSANERLRVESYLALKYGLTINEKVSYLSSRNIIFWDEQNNKIFGNRIFGMGRDNISGLNQLQSESTHLKNHLISAFGPILETNKEKQKTIEIDNNHFLVFGDNGGKRLLKHENTTGIVFWDKVWLAERTGSKISEISVDFKLRLTGQLEEHLENNLDHIIWMLHDKNIGHDEVSEFDSSIIEYYQGEVDTQNGFVNFENIYFDTDFSVYDQFTFGVGPKMVIEARLVGCKGDRLQMVLDIYGGEPEYEIYIESGGEVFEDSTEENTYSYEVQDGVVYDITVVDSQGTSFNMTFTPQPWDFSLDLGGTQYITNTQPQVILDAGQGINDPDATYSWYLEGNQLPDTGSTLTVTEVGYYEVVITSGDYSCSVSDYVEVEYVSFSGVITVNNGCENQENYIGIQMDGGIPTFTTVLTSNGQSVNYVHGTQTTINNLAYGSYHIDITDSTGEVYSDNFDIVLPPPNLGIDVFAQLEAICGYSCMDYSFSPPLFNYDSENEPFSIDVSVGAYSNNLQYEWVLNEMDIFSNNPETTFLPGFDCYPGGDPGLPHITVNVFDPVTGCSVSESFLMRTFCPEEYEERQAQTDIAGTDYIGSLVYPNPTEKSNTFIYEVYSSGTIQGTVELYTMTGAVLYSVDVADANIHKIPFRLDSAGVYLIKITTSEGITKTNRIIIN